MAIINNKTITRMLEISVGFKNHGDGAKAIGDMATQVKAFVAANPSASIEDVSEACRILGNNYKAISPLMAKFIKDTQLQGTVVQQYAKALTQLKGTLGSLIAPIGSISALVGGEGLGFKEGIQWVIGYQKQMLGLSAQFSKYGRGMGDLEGALKKVGDQTGLTMKESADLYAVYEKGFPFNSLENGEKLFKNIKEAVGGNSDAMKAMLQDLQGIVEKFPELEDGITHLSDNNRNLLESQSRLAFMTGKLSLAEHKRFEDYLHGGKQVKTADQQRREEMQGQIDAMNNLRRVFEQIAKQIGDTLIPWMKKLSDHAWEIYNHIKPHIPLITQIGAGLAVVLVASKAIAAVWGTGKMFGKLPGMNALMPGAVGPSGGGRGGWNRKALGFNGATLGNGKFWARNGAAALGGAASGFVAGRAVNLGYEAMTGRDLDTDHGMAAVGGQVAKTGTQIGAGFATGGVTGGIGAGLMSILENIYHLLQTWYGDTNSIKTIKADVQQANKNINKADNKNIDTLKDRLGKETDPFKKAQLEQSIQSAEFLKKAHKEDRDKSQRSSGYGAAAYRTAMNFSSYVNPAENAVRLAGIDPIAEREKAEDQAGLGASSSDKAKNFYKQNRDMAVQQKQQRDANDKGKIENALAGTNIKLDDKQFQELFKAMDLAREGFTDKLTNTGVNARKAGYVGNLWEQGNSKEFADVARQAASGISGQKYTPSEKTAEDESRSGIGTEKVDKEVNAKGAQAMAHLDKGDLVQASKEYRSLMDVLDKAEVQNVMRTDTKSEGVLKQYGVDTSKVIGANSQETFASKGDAYKQFENAQQNISSEMAELDKKAKDSGQPLQKKDADRYDVLKSANESINRQLQERGKLFDQQSPKLQMLDAAFNAHAKSVSATNELLQAQKGYLDAIISSAQTTGNIDMGKIQKSTENAIASLHQYNDGLQRRIKLEQEQMEVEAKERDDTMQKNKDEAASLRKATKNDGSKKTDDEQKKDNDKAISLEHSNKLLEIQGKLGVLDQETKAETLKHLAEAETIQRQIVETIAKQGELNKANVDFASANVSKAEALIDIYDNMGAGLKASAQMRMDAANLMGKQIEEEKKNLANLEDARAKGLPHMAAEVGKEQAFQGKPHEDILAEANKRLVAIDTQRVQKQTTILGLIQKQAQMTKAVRDGYVSAIMAMTAGSGMFNKILITQDKNLGVGVKYMNVLQSKTSGGIGGGKQEAARYTLNGIVDNDRTKGYKDWSGMDSNNNDVGLIQQQALARTQALAGSIVSQNTGAIGAPNNTGAVLQAVAQGQQPFPPAQAHVNNGGTITNIGPATVPNSGNVAPGGVSQVTPASQPVEGTTLLKQISDTETETLNVLRRIETKLGGSTTTVPGHRDGGVIGRYRDGGLVGLYRDGGGVSGLTGGESEKGDQYQIGVAGGEVIMNQRQWPRVASALGMSPDEFANMVQAKDYTRLPDAKYRDGGFVVGKYVNGGGPVGGVTEQPADKLAPKQIEFVYDGSREHPVIDNGDAKKMVVHIKQGTKFNEQNFTEHYKGRLDEFRHQRSDNKNKSSEGAYATEFGVQEDVSFVNKVVTPAKPQDAQVSSAQQPQNAGSAQPSQIQNGLVDKANAVAGSLVAKGKEVVLQAAHGFQENNALQIKELPDKITLLNSQIAALEKPMSEDAIIYKSIINKTDGRWDGLRIADRTIEDSFPRFRGKESVNENVYVGMKWQISPDEFRVMSDKSDHYIQLKNKKIELQKQLYLFEQQFNNLANLGQAFPQAVTAPIAPANKPQTEPSVKPSEVSAAAPAAAQLSTTQPTAALPAATPAVPVQRMTDDSTSTPITGKTLADTLKNQPASPVGPAAQSAALPNAPTSSVVSASAPEDVIPHRKGDVDSPYWNTNNSLPTPTQFKDEIPMDADGNRIARLGWVYANSADGTRWYSPEEAAIIKSEIKYDWKKHQVIPDRAAASSAKANVRPKKDAQKGVGPARKDHFDVTKNYDVGIGYGSYLRDQEKERKKERIEDAQFTYREGGIVPRFATGGVVPNMGEAQKEAMKALGIGSKVGGDRTLVLATPGEKFTPQSASPILPASVDRVMPRESRPAMPQQETAGDSKTIQPIINFNGIQVDYGDLNKFGNVVKTKIDAALDDVLQQMSGRRSTLPRSN